MRLRARKRPQSSSIAIKLDVRDGSVSGEPLAVVDVWNRAGSRHRASRLHRFLAWMNSLDLARVGQPISNGSGVGLAYLPMISQNREER
jgi:hypothetical protein